MCGEKERSTNGTLKEVLTGTSFSSKVGVFREYGPLTMKCQNTLTSSAGQPGVPVAQLPQQANTCAQLQSGGSHADGSPLSSTYAMHLFILRIMTSWLQSYFSFKLLVHSFMLLMNETLSLHAWFDKTIKWMILQARVSQTPLPYFGEQIFYLHQPLGSDCNNCSCSKRVTVLMLYFSLLYSAHKWQLLKSCYKPFLTARLFWTLGFQKSELTTKTI